MLNIGEEQGAVQDGEMLVSREGKLVAKVIISRVEKTIASPTSFPAGSWAN